MLTVLLLALLASNDGILAFPGTTYTGKIVAGDKTACRLTLWDGMAPFFPLLSAEERKQLEAAVKDVETKWPQAGSWRERAALISPYYHVLFDKNRELPFRRKFATYQQIALTCGNDTVRGVAVDLPPMGAGGLVVLKHPVQPEYVVFVDVAPQAQEDLEDIGAFVARYRAQLEKAERPDELPAEARKEMAALQRKMEQKGSRRLQFWDVNGMVLPTCPGACPPRNPGPRFRATFARGETGLFPSPGCAGLAPEPCGRGRAILRTARSSFGHLASRAGREQVRGCEGGTPAPEQRAVFFFPTE